MNSRRILLTRRCLTVGVCPILVTSMLCLEGAFATPLQSETKPSSSHQTLEQTDSLRAMHRRSAAILRPTDSGRLLFVPYRVIDVQPRRAHPGDLVRVATDPPLNQARLVFLTFNGRSAEVSFEGGDLRARVPLDTETDTSAEVILTVMGRPSAPFNRLFVLPPTFRILSVAPNPVGLGDTLHIFFQPLAQLKPGDQWLVMFDSLARQPVAVNAARSEVIVVVPSDLESHKPIIVVHAMRLRSDAFQSLVVDHPMPRLYIIMIVAAVLSISLLIYMFALRIRRMGSEDRIRSSRMLARPLSAEPAIQEDRTFYPLPSIRSELIEACVNNECVLYVGSGMSAAAGFPTWLPFLQDLLSWAAEKQLLDQSVLDSLRFALAQGQTGAVADNIVNAMRDRGGVLNDFLRDVFLHPRPPLPKTHAIIKDIGFSAVLTTNFDTLIERTFDQPNVQVLTPDDAEPLLESLSKRNFFVLKLYGMPERPDTVLVAPEEYLDAVARNKVFTQFMETLFFSRTLLFVGSSLEGIEDYLKGITFRENRGRLHFALVNVAGTAWQAKAASLNRRYGIQVLPYTATEGFPEVVAFVSDLKKSIDIRRGNMSAQEDKPESTEHRGTPLRKLRLENIGPFETLEINLDQHLNILLGDNGVGKSTILKAIAVGVCGNDAQPYAGRLIKSGRREAKIILETDRNQYITQLLRKEEGAELVVRPGRPLEAEGWLALGFPPLRSVTWQPSKEPQPQGKSIPHAADLLPIIKGEPDPRMDDLKQWLVNLDYMASAGDKNTGASERYLALREEFFTIIDRLTPGVRIQYKAVNPVTKQVTVITDDGVVPIESVSQGTTSLISWIGVLLQRVFEVYGDEKKPTERFTLVLIDEIDAHMHPEWQQLLVHELREIFPNTQFVATTHSPLIVGGLSPEQIVRLRRTPDGKVQKIAVDADMTMGRADQVLTSELFDLSTTVDKETQQRISEYQQLLGMSVRNPEQEARYRRLEEILRFRIPMSAETVPERRAQDLVQAILRSQGGADFPEATKAVEDKASALLKSLSSRGGKMQ